MTVAASKVARVVTGPLFLVQFPDRSNISFAGPDIVALALGLLRWRATPPARLEFWCSEGGSSLLSRPAT